jgi:hypothetical protein
MYPSVHSSGQCLDLKNYVIHDDTNSTFDPEPARQLHPNACNRTFVLNPSALCLHLLSTYAYAQESGRSWRPRHDSICAGTALSVSTRNQRRYGSPISLVLLAVPLFAVIRDCIDQLCVLFLRPVTCHLVPVTRSASASACSASASAGRRGFFVAGISSARCSSPDARSQGRVRFAALQCFVNAPFRFGPSLIFFRNGSFGFFGRSLHCNEM